MNKQDLYFDICLEFIIKVFGKNPGIGRGQVRSFLTTYMVTPTDGGHVCRFNSEDLKWEDWEQRFTSWNIVQNGKVFVSYPEDDPMDGGMFFKTEHPREVSELLSLMVQPVSYFLKELPASQPQRLGDLVDIYVVTPAGTGWQATNSAGTLSDGTPLIRGGYLADKYLNLCHPLDLLMQTAQDTAPSLNVLLVPSRKDVSALYIREYLNGDAEAAKQLREAFADESDMNKIQAGLGDVPIQMPADLFDQIQLAAQTNLMRHMLIQQAESVAYARAPFDQLTTRYRDAARAMEALKV
jgi:hypothetical protein